MFCEGFFSFPFTHNVLVHSELREVGEAVKAINENLLTCGCVRSCVYARNARDCARLFVLLIGESGGKVGRNARESGEG